MRPSEIQAVQAHRPWPVPRGPWIITQVWQNLLFAHWPVPVSVMQPLIPAPLTLDVREGSAWLSISPFLVTRARPHFVLPVPPVSRFLEMNVRTYVVYDDKPGILFFSLDASNPLIAAAARTFYRLPYIHARMQCRPQGQGFYYESKRRDSVFRVTYRPVSERWQAETDTLDYWLVERYCLYTTDRQGRLYRGEIHHPPWPLQTAEADIIENTASPVPLDGGPVRLHYAERQDTLIWPLEKVGKT